MFQTKKLSAIYACLGIVLAAAIPSAEPWKFGVMGDTQWKSTIDGGNPNTVSVGIIKQINAEFIKQKVKLVVQVGDLVDVFSPAAFDTRAKAAQDLIDAGIGFFPLRGNHEGSAAAAKYFSTAFPQTCGFQNTFGAKNFQSASMSLECLSYSFDFNNVRFVLIDQFTRNDNTGANNNDNILDQIGWIREVLESRASNCHSVVFAHKNIIGQNHGDVIFGSNMTSNASAQNLFFKNLSDNGVRYYIGGHDHMHHRSIVYSPDRNYTINQLITSSDSYKFYSPQVPSYDQRYSGNTPRELPVSQELFTVGFYIFTVDGQEITVDYYSSLNGCGGSWEAGGIDCDLTVTPSLKFCKRETFGYNLDGKEYIIHPGDPFTVVKDTCKMDGSEKTEAAILSGLNKISPTIYDGRSTVQNVTTGWMPNSHTSGNLKSDILTLRGMANKPGSEESDIYTLSLTYKGELNGPLSLVSKSSSGDWINTAQLNMLGNPKFVVGPYKENYTLGTYGIDPAKKTVWAVVNHGGEFAIANSTDGDQDGDGDIDNDDVDIIASLKNKTANVKPSADLDNDGKITILDARKCVLIRTM